jgi:hypothetical protein
MTAAQKAAKANFKKAIAYRQKTGVSLKEAFAHVYGKKVGAAPKKKAAKKAAPKKAAKKVVKKAAPKKIGLSIAKKAAAKVKSLARKAQDAYYEGFYEGKPAALAKKRAELKAKRVSAAKKKVSEKSILNKIHKVKNEVSELDELQHKHMIGAVDKMRERLIKEYNWTYTDVKNLERELGNMQQALKENPKAPKHLKDETKKYIVSLKSLLKEEKEHLKEIKKLL